MRITVSLLVSLVTKGKSVTDIIQEYPDLEAGDIQQALEYAAWLTREQVYTSPPTIFIICQTVNK
jgi:uncharacterized protein (DUF433 family)